MASLHRAPHVLGAPKMRAQRAFRAPGQFSASWIYGQSATKKSWCTYGESCRSRFFVLQVHPISLGRAFKKLPLSPTRRRAKAASALLGALAARHEKGIGPIATRRCTTSKLTQQRLLTGKSFGFLPQGPLCRASLRSTWGPAGDA